MTILLALAGTAGGVEVACRLAAGACAPHGPATPDVSPEIPTLAPVGPDTTTGITVFSKREKAAKHR